MRPNRLDLIKQQQLEDSPEIYEAAETTAPLQVDIPAVANNMFEQLQAAMTTDLARIKTAKKLEEKQAIKADLLPGYLPFVTEFVEQGHDYPNSVAVRVMIWLFDVNNIEQGLKLGLHLISLGTQSLPEKFDRDIPTFIADAIYDWASVQLKAEHTANPYLDDWNKSVAFSEWDLHPAVVSKNLVMQAKHALREADPQSCLDLCERAEQVNPEKAGVKGLKKTALKELEKLKEQKEN